MTAEWLSRGVGGHFGVTDGQGEIRPVTVGVVMFRRLTVESSGTQSHVGTYQSKKGTSVGAEVTYKNEQIMRNG